MIITETSFGKAVNDLEGFVSKYQDEIKTVLENLIKGTRISGRLEARYHPFATWEIVLSPEPAVDGNSAQTSREAVLLDLFFNMGFGAGGTYKQLIIRRYANLSGCPQSRDIKQQKYIMLPDDKNPAEVLQNALSDLLLGE